MLRLEPFTFLARQLQGRRFDHADRMFHSMAEVWQGVKENTSDTKELIPEVSLAASCVGICSACIIWAVRCACIVFFFVTARYPCLK
jgi:hypothetical protein